jgi:quercetin dioxygenase-like cupin family protein
MMKFKVIEQNGDDVLVEKDGTLLNVNIAHAVSVAFGETVVLPAPAVPYTFNKGQGIPAHKHSRKTVHDIRVVAGSVLVRKDSGDVTATKGERVVIAVNEMHSVEALEDGTVTLHILLHKPNGPNTRTIRYR